MESGKERDSYTSYEVITPYSEDKLNSKCTKIARKILSKFTEKGFKFTPKTIIDKNKILISHSCSNQTFSTYHYNVLKMGVSTGILSKCNTDLYDDISNLKSIKYWQSQLRSSKYKNLKTRTSDAKSTKGLYLYLLNEFNKWLVSKEFSIKKTIPISEDTLRTVQQNVIFSSVEELLTLFDNSPSSQKDIIKIIREYLNLPEHEGSSPSYMKSKFSAIMSYFEKNESPLGMKFDSKKFDDQEIKSDSELTLAELYTILTVGQPSVMEKSVILVKFQGGFDSSTLADRFNFDGLHQIHKYFGSENHNSWDLEKCPVPLKYIRMKTGFQHSPLLDRDAIVSIQRYLDWRIKEYGFHDANGCGKF